MMALRTMLGPCMFPKAAAMALKEKGELMVLSFPS